MINAIVYKSNTGFTKKYAEMLSEELSLPIYSLNKISKLNKNTNIIYMGNVFASNINGYKNIKDKLNIEAVVAVGMTFPSIENNNQLKEVNKIENNLFYLHGGLDKQKLKGFKKLIINLIGKSLEKNPDKDEKMVEIFKNGGDFVSKDNLDEIIKWYKSR